MSDKPKTRRMLRDLRQVAAEERERSKQHRGWVEEMRAKGCPNPEDPLNSQSGRPKRSASFRNLLASMKNSSGGCARKKKNSKQ